MSPLTVTAEISSPTTATLPTIQKRRDGHQDIIPDGHRHNRMRHPGQGPSFVRSPPQKDSGVRNFSFPFRRQHELPSHSKKDTNRYSSVTNRILDEYME